MTPAFAKLENFQAAEVVLGQPNFTSTATGAKNTSDMKKGDRQEVLPVPFYKKRSTKALDKSRN